MLKACIPPRQKPNSLICCSRYCRIHPQPSLTAVLSLPYLLHEIYYSLHDSHSCPSLSGLHAIHPAISILSRIHCPSLFLQTPIHPLSFLLRMVFILSPRQQYTNLFLTLLIPKNIVFYSVSIPVCLFRQTAHMFLFVQYISQFPQQIRTKVLEN